MNHLILAGLLLLAFPLWAEALAIGDQVKVVGTNALNVRVCPAGTVIGTQPLGMTGRIVGGTGVLVNGYHRWDVDYTTGADGCSAQEYLQVVTLTDPGSTPPGDQAPGTWQKLTFAAHAVDQPLLGGDQSIAEGLPGAAYTTCPRPMQTTAAGIVRSFSGVLIAEDRLLVIGGGHAGHPGNDLELLDYTAETYSKPYAAECPPAYVNGLPNPVWRGIKGGAVMTGGLSPMGRPWVEHVYMNHAFDALRGRYLQMNGNGLMAYTLATRTWSILAGTNRDAGEVIWGSSGGMVFDPASDSVLLFVSTAGNGAARGVYEYSFNAAGAVIAKRYVRPWPTTAGTCWGCANLITALLAPERHEVLLMVTPSSTSPSTPRNQLWRYSLVSETLTRDTSWIPGTPQYDDIWEEDETRARLLTRVNGQTWLMHRGGAWVQDDRVGGQWEWVAMPGAPELIWWTLACDTASAYCVGLTARSAYCGVPAVSCGGLTDLWRYRRP